MRVKPKSKDYNSTILAKLKFCFYCNIIDKKFQYYILNILVSMQSYY
jgi:hypothetical protein